MTNLATCSVSPWTSGNALEHGAGVSAAFTSWDIRADPSVPMQIFPNSRLNMGEWLLWLLERKQGPPGRGGRRSIHSIHDVEYEELRRYGILLRRNDVVAVQFRHQEPDFSPVSGGDAAGGLVVIGIDLPKDPHDSVRAREIDHFRRRIEGHIVDAVGGRQ